MDGPDAIGLVRFDYLATAFQRRKSSSHTHIRIIKHEAVPGRRALRFAFRMDGPAASSIGMTFRPADLGRKRWTVKRH